MTKTKYDKFQVAVDTNARHVEIIADGHEPSAGHRTVGEFEANAIEGKLKGDPDFDTKGDHLYVAKAKSILEDLEIRDFQNMVYEDKASSAPTGESYIPTIKEVSDAVRKGESPAEYRSEVSEKLDKAEDKLDESEHRKAGKNDHKPRSE